MRTAAESTDRIRSRSEHGASQVTKLAVRKSVLFLVVQEIGHKARLRGMIFLQDKTSMSMSYASSIVTIAIRERHTDHLPPDIVYKAVEELALFLMPFPQCLRYEGHISQDGVRIDYMRADLDHPS